MRIKQTAILISALIVIALLFLWKKSQNQITIDRNATIITLYGKADPRFRIIFKTVYVPVRGDGAWVDRRCPTYLSMETGKRKPKSVFVTKTFTDVSEYNVSIPIYNIELEDKCNYVFTSLEVIIRPKRGDQFGLVPIVTDYSPTYINQGTKHSYNGGGGKSYLYLKKKKYFYLPTGKTIGCYSETYEKGERMPENSNFHCDINYREPSMGLDTLIDQSIQLHILVDKESCIYIGNGIHKDYFREP